jgi:hypothetical protein
LATGKASSIELLRKWIFEANQAEKWVSDENWLEMKSFLKKVGLSRVLRDQTLTVAFKKPWNLLLKPLSPCAARTIFPSEI